MCHVPSSLVAAAEDVDEGGARFVEDGAQANGNSAGVAGSSTSRRVRAYVDFHATDPYNNGNGGRPTPLDVNVALKADIKSMKKLASSGNVTWFHPRERDHPIHFWEQRIRCYDCGRDHFLPAFKGHSKGVAGMAFRCCHHADCLLSRAHSLPDAVLDVVSHRTGCSSSSRMDNAERQLAAMALPKNGHWNPDRGGGMKING